MDATDLPLYIRMTVDQRRRLTNLVDKLCAELLLCGRGKLVFLDPYEVNGFKQIAKDKQSEF